MIDTSCADDLVLKETEAENNDKLNTSQQQHMLQNDTVIRTLKRENSHMRKQLESARLQMAEKSEEADQMQTTGTIRN